MTESTDVLGKRVQDVVTGFEGIATAYVQYLTGSNQIGVQAKAKGNTAADVHYFDVARIKVIDEGVYIEQADKSIGFCVGDVL